MLVDLLSSGSAPAVDGLVTVGSQAPLFYAIDALEHLRPGAGPEPFTPWLNIYNEADLLSFCAERVFPGTAASVTLPSTPAWDSRSRTSHTGGSQRVRRDQGALARPGRAVIHKPHLFRALIVAVDKYDDEDIKELKSPVTDACQVLRWLHALGVPPENIICHVASSSPHKDRLDEVASPLRHGSPPARAPRRGPCGWSMPPRVHRRLGLRAHLSVESDDPPVESDNPPVESDDPPVESDDPPVESDDPPVESDDPSVESASLIVFLLGHGFMLPKRSEPTSRSFITQDYTKAITTGTSPWGT